MNSMNMLKVMSFNIRFDDFKDYEKSWANRRKMAGSIINFHHPDIIGLQEALKNQIDDLLAMNLDYEYVGVGREDGKNKGEFSAILYNKERIKPVSNGTFWLSETPNVPGKKGWDADCPRVVTYLKFIDRHNDKTIVHFNTHFDNYGKTARRESAYLLLENIEKIAGNFPIVVTGDFNCLEEGEAYKILTGKETKVNYKENVLIDACYASESEHYGPKVTYIGGLGDNNVIGKIDYIFVKNNINVIRHGVLSDNWNGKYASDHIPLISEIFVKE